MNIILVPGKRGRAQNACFSHRHLLVFALVGLIGLPAFFGALTYRIHDMLARAAGEGAQIAAQERELGRQRAVVETARREASTHINALALRRARLQPLESLLLDRKLSAKVTPRGWPVDGGWVSSGYGLRVDPFTGHQSMHEGADIASRMGLQIQAQGEGVSRHT